MRMPGLAATIACQSTRPTFGWRCTAAWSSALTGSCQRRGTAAFTRTSRRLRPTVWITVSTSEGRTWPLLPRWTTIGPGLTGRHPGLDDRDRLVELAALDRVDHGAGPQSGHDRGGAAQDHRVTDHQRRPGEAGRWRRGRGRRTVVAGSVVVVGATVVDRHRRALERDRRWIVPRDGMARTSPMASNGTAKAAPTTTTLALALAFAPIRSRSRHGSRTGRWRRCGSASR